MRLFFSMVGWKQFLIFLDALMWGTNWDSTCSENWADEKNRREKKRKGEESNRALTLSFFWPRVSPLLKRHTSYMDWESFEKTFSVLGGFFFSYLVTLISFFWVTFFREKMKEKGRGLTQTPLIMAKIFWFLLSSELPVQVHVHWLCI